MVALRAVLLGPRARAARRCASPATSSRRCRDDVHAHSSPRLNAPPAPFVPERAPARSRATRLLLVGFGEPSEHDGGRRADPRATLPPLFELVDADAVRRAAADVRRGQRLGHPRLREGVYLDDLTDEVIAVLAEHARAQGVAACRALLFYRLDGAYASVGDGRHRVRRRPRRRGTRSSSSAIAADAGDAGRRARVGARRSGTRCSRSRRCGVGSYVNVEAESDDDRVRRAYGPPSTTGWPRIKAAYDPDNVFHRNANIRPAVPRLRVSSRGGRRSRRGRQSIRAMGCPA